MLSGQPSKPPDGRGRARIRTAKHFPPETKKQQPGPREARVIIKTAGVSFVDVLTASGGYQVNPLLPFVPGTEFTSIIKSINPRVSQIVRNDYLSGYDTTGAFAQSIIVPADRVHRQNPQLQRSGGLYVTAWHASVAGKIWINMKWVHVLVQTIQQRCPRIGENR